MGATRSQVNDGRDGKDSANARVILGYDSYFGRYTIDERAGTITHRVEGSLFPEIGRAHV